MVSIATSFQKAVDFIQLVAKMVRMQVNEEKTLRKKVEQAATLGSIAVATTAVITDDSRTMQQTRP